MIKVVVNRNNLRKKLSRRRWQRLATDVANDGAHEAVARVASHAPIDTGTGFRSIRSKRRQSTIYARGYMYVQNYGRRAGLPAPPYTKIRKWARRKGLIPRSGISHAEADRRAKAIANKIGRKGYKGKLFAQKGVQEYFDSREFAKNVERNLMRIFK